MRDLDRTGGFAALTAAATVIVGLVMFATTMSGYTTEDLAPSEAVAYVVDNQATMYVWNLITLVVFGIALVFVTFALYDRLKDRAAGIARVSVGFGLIWSGLLIGGGMVTNVGMDTVVDLAETDPVAAGPTWSAIESVGNALSGQIEIVGAVWILLVSLAALRNGALPRALGFLGVVMAISALVTIVPALEMVAIVFGLGLIVWFGWVGVELLRNSRVETPRDEAISQQRASALHG